jgi:hypothetical protein
MRLADGEEEQLREWHLAARCSARLLDMPKAGSGDDTAPRALADRAVIPPALSVRERSFCVVAVELAFHNAENFGDDLLIVCRARSRREAFAKEIARRRTLCWARLVNKS